METMSADDPFITEYQLLESYHKKRKSRSIAKPRHPIVLQGWSGKYQQPIVNRCEQVSAGKRVPASAEAEPEAFAQVADKLTHIVDSAPPAQDQVVTDCGVIQRLVELLKEYGDQVNEKIQKDKELLSYLQGLFSYNLFEELASAFIHSMVTPGKQREEDIDQKMKIAWTFEMTSRLSALDLQPMNRAMGFGAQYVHQHFAPWIQQHGGWENAFKSDEDDEVQ
ncbi:hypothetical protein PHYPO_G00213840 [Pangasianodon hypophthalmus]|uniref:Apoptosis facilitator Bcl-2-like protein 14 n=1 Tax=Pangasianodon hypophthalmus TaxID=310915 RepID=A0A5N5P7N1_PANHP|nr:apoptosis facilitator Bcl-2-like protein 14 [Pangasianodon hypophthalmus]KAB5574846.1 hypothetical protein PHYPO_G00213840 [Pangasianodon hypophthalmus]